MAAIRVLLSPRCYPTPPEGGPGQSSSIFLVGGVSQKQVVGALPQHGPCHLPNRVVTEAVTRDCPQTRGEQGVFVPNNLLHSAAVSGWNEPPFLFDFFFFPFFIE